MSSVTEHHTTTTTGCGCGCTGGAACGGLASLERPRYFPRQLIGPDDLSQDQRYLRDKARRHHRLLHGWGIVCGAGVAPGERPCEVLVAPGYVLGPQGDEIVIEREVTFDVCSTGTALDPCGGVDPWCTEVRAQRPEGQDLYLAVRAVERPARPVRVTACGCGGDEEACEYSRTRDGFELTVLSELPEPYRVERTQAQELRAMLAAFVCLGAPRECPPCPPSPWVILADLALDAEQRVTPTGAPHRRYVVSFADVFFTCARDLTVQKTTGLGALLGATRPNAYTDVQALAVGAEPVASVAAKRADGQWTTVPGTFTVEKGETLKAMLRREGDRELLDGATGGTVTLRELYATAGADPAATVAGVADALGHLEARTLDVDGLRVVRGALQDVFDVHGLERLESAHAGSPGAAAELPARALRGVESDSPVGKHVAGRTVAEVAAQPEDAFVTAATKGLRGARRTSETERAETVWGNARRAVRLAEGWSR